MRREIVGLAVVAALLLTASGSFAGEQVKTGEPAPAPPDPISEALCGRGPAGAELTLAEALDSYDLAVLPVAWRTVTLEELRRWNQARTCTEASMEESRQFKLRRGKTDHILKKLDPIKATDAVGTSLLSLAKRQPKSAEWSKPDVWPTTAECSGCAALRRAAVAVKSGAVKWPKRRPVEARLGPLYDSMRDHGILIAEVCTAKPSHGASEEMNKRFGYYTWTAAGAWLLDVANWFEQPEVIARCGRP